MFEDCLTPAQRDTFANLTTPVKIQEFLDTIPYRPEDEYLSPLRSFQHGKAHCFDGGLLAAAALRRLGYPPVIVQLQPEADDDHILATFKRNGCWGAVGKSNYVGLRYRDPIYRSLRELVMSYFEDFYNLERLKSLRGYSFPLDLRRFDRYDWECSDAGAARIWDLLPSVRKIWLLTPQQVAELPPIDERSFLGGMLGTDMAGVFDPAKHR